MHRHNAGHIAVGAIEKAGTEIGKPDTVQASFQGTAQEFQASLSTQPMLILAALFVVYVVLGVLYESFVHPITILLSLPSACVGALFFLNVFGFDLTMMAIIGLIMLIGIVAGDLPVHAEVQRVGLGSSFSLLELEERIVIIRDNIRQLVEQAAAFSDAEDEA